MVCRFPSGSGEVGGVAWARQAHRTGLSKSWRPEVGGRVGTQAVDSPWAQGGWGQH